MHAEKRTYRLDDRMQAILADAKEISRLLLGSQIAYPEHFFLAMLFVDEVHIRETLSAVGGEGLYGARTKTRKYLSEPIRHAHVGNTEELLAGMSKGLLELVSQAAKVAVRMSEDAIVAVTPELVLVSGEYERVATDIVIQRWGISPEKLRMYYRRQGIAIPITYQEEQRLLYAVAATDSEMTFFIKSIES